MSEADQSFYLPWWERLRASNSKAQHVQNRCQRAFFAACRARDMEQQVVQAEADAVARRAANAQRMRISRAAQAKARA